MTCIVALKTINKTVVLGGDSFCGDDEVANLCHAPKVYKVGPIGVGLCGQVRTEQILERILKKVIPKQEERGELTEEWLVYKLPNIIRKAMKKHGVLDEEQGTDQLDDSEYIFAFDSKIYFLNKDFGFWDTQHQYGAIGAGKQFALGALAYASETSKVKKSPHQVVQMALEAAATWSPWVRAPFAMVEVGGEK